MYGGELGRKGVNGFPKRKGIKIGKEIIKMYLRKAVKTKGKRGGILLIL